MEWLRHVDLSEYAPNLRGSGVHGALLVHETRFTAEILAGILSIPPSKTLLRRHLSLHIKVDTVIGCVNRCLNFFFFRRICLDLMWFKVKEMQNQNQIFSLFHPQPRQNIQRKVNSLWRGKNLKQKWILKTWFVLLVQDELFCKI